MNNHPIGILDSGVGGLSVWKEIIKELPQESTVYIADSKNIPYGTKSPEDVYRLAKRLVEFLIEKHAKIIIIACNTITVTCIDRLRKEYPGVPIIGTVPVVKTAAEVSKHKRIGIFSTTRTAESQYQRDLINRFARDCEVTSVGSDELVPLIESGKVQGKEIENVLKDVLRPFKEQQVDTIALGCTHYPFVSREIKKILGKQVQLLEPSGAIARHTRRILSQNKILDSYTSPKHSFYITGEANAFSSVAKKLLGATIAEELIVQRI